LWCGELPDVAPGLADPQPAAAPLPRALAIASTSQVAMAAPLAAPSPLAATRPPIAASVPCTGTRAGCQPAIEPGFRSGENGLGRLGGRELRRLLGLLSSELRRELEHRPADGAADQLGLVGGAQVQQLAAGQLA